MKKYQSTNDEVNDGKDVIVQATEETKDSEEKSISTDGPSSIASAESRDNNALKESKHNRPSEPKPVKQEKTDEDEASSENEDERSLSELAERMRASFDKWDIDGDNEISEEDLMGVLEGTDAKDVWAMLQQYNRNPNSRKIEFPKFLSSSLRKLGRVQKEPPKDIVTSMDRSLARKRPNWRGLSSVPSGTTPPQHEEVQAVENTASSKACDRDADGRDV